MILKHLMYGLTPFLMATAAHAALVRTLNEMQVIEVPISQQGLTRIKVKDDRILHVFGIAGEYVLETDEDQGQVFIRPVGFGTPDFSGASLKPINLTLTTEAGHTQDLRLMPKNMAPEALILEVDTEIKQELEKEKRTPLFREEVEELIRACQEGRIPLGYKEMPISLAALHEPYHLIREIQGEKLRGLTYRVQNNTKETQVLSAEEFAKGVTLQPNALIALLISQKTLKPGERTDVYVAARAN
ncbi:MAG TPA: type-F conjugative transfer system secretin TraK [Alphaproteobacteria bacterium]|nr:type-F conjugative transfer system secretin TraK [Alphaproteobacteria bacterium]